MILESDWETFTIDHLAELGWAPTTGSQTLAERAGPDDLVLHDRFTQALRRLNPTVPDEYLGQVRADIMQLRSADAITENRRFHTWLVGGYRGLSYLGADGQDVTPTIRLLGSPAENDYLAVQQVRLEQGDHKRRFDIICYVNGLPLVIVELKGAGAKANTATAIAQLHTYLDEFPMAFRHCVLTVASNGLDARYGTPFTSDNHYSPWKVDEQGQPITDPGVLQLESLVYGLFDHDRFGDIICNFVAFDEEDGALTKRVAKPHQYFAVRRAVDRTLDAVASNGKAGVVWHTQGSGKSMEMELYTALVLTHPELLNPTVVVITDRKELDGQLFATFQRSTLLPEQPVQVTTRAQLRSELTSRKTGGILFTTLQKFSLSTDEARVGADHPLLSDRHNVIVIVDEAHRSHYDDLDGYARHLRDALPHATMIAFTGTPISFTDRNTREVFGDYIDIYDLTRAVADGATVPVYFEPRLVQVKLAEDLSPEQIDLAADESTTGLDDAERDRIEKSVAVINAIYGAPRRLEQLATDIVSHWEQRRELMSSFLGGSPGKAMIVGATRQICADLYAQIIRLRPGWRSDSIDAGVIKVVYSGTAADPAPIRAHVRRDSENKVIKQRLREGDDELELVIVKDMMLTGFDAPPLHTMYLDRPLQGALLMQALARVNRTFEGKQDGLLVAYAPIAENLNAALAEYTVADQAARPVGKPVDEAAALVRSLVTALDEMTAGSGWRQLFTADDKKSWIKAVLHLTNWLRTPSTPGNKVPEGEQTLAARYRLLSGQLSRMWAIASGNETVGDLRRTIRFYEEVRVWMAKFDAQERQGSDQPIPEDIQRLLLGLVAKATAAGEITDIYDAAGLAKPDLGKLNEAAIQRITERPNSQLAIEALRNLLQVEAVRVTGTNVVRRKVFSERLTGLMNRYTNQQLTAAEVLAELASLANEVTAEANRGNRFDPPLSHDEMAFYDAVAQNDAALEQWGDEKLAAIARDLVTTMRSKVRVDWSKREDVRAALRAEVKRLLRQYGYPPDRQEDAVLLVLEQLESLAPGYAHQRRPGT